MSFQSMAWAVKQNTKNSISKLILLMLANYADEEHACYPSITHIAELCHCSERSVKRHIKDLRIRGYIKIGKIKGRVNNCNRYILGSANALPLSVWQRIFFLFSSLYLSFSLFA